MTQLMSSFRNSIITTLILLKRASSIFPWRRSSFESAIARHQHIPRLPTMPMRRCPICNKDGNGTGEIVRFIGRIGACTAWNALCPCCGGNAHIPAKADDYRAFRRNNEVIFLQLS